MSDNPVSKPTLGQFVLARRTDLGINQTQAAALSGMSTSAWCNLEKDKRNLSVATLRKIAAALGIEAGELGSYL